jgi:hypothetical protein
MPKLKTDKEIKAETIRELEGFKLSIRGSIDDGLYIMAAREEFNKDSKQGVINTIFYHLEKGDMDVLERVRKKYLKLKENAE